MWSFLVSHAGTIVTALVLAAVIFFVVRSMIRARKAGKGCCGGSCSACSACCRGRKIPLRRTDEAEKRTGVKADDGKR